MIDQLIDKVIDQGGIWCCLCVYMILYTNKKYTILEKEVRTTLKEALEKNTKALNKVKECPYDANTNRE